MQVRAHHYLGTTFRNPLLKTDPFLSFILLSLFPPSSTFLFFSANEYDSRRWLRGPKGSFKAGIRYECYYSFLNTLVSRMKKEDFRL